jgi:hypothetical protein
MWNEHLQEVSKELVTTLHELPVNKLMGVLKIIKKKLTGNPAPEKQVLTSPNHEWLLPPGDLQRVPAIIPPTQRVEQRVVDEVPTLQRVTEAPPIMVAPNPTAQHTLKLTKWTHMRQMQNNTSGTILTITQAPSMQQPLPPPILAPTTAAPPQSPHTNATQIPPTCIPGVHFQPIQGGI